MLISRDLVGYFAELSRLKLSEEQEKKIGAEINAFLDFAQLMEAADTEGEEPLTHILAAENVWREDLVEPSLDREALLANAAERSEETVVVPKTVE